jgi:hypothetical protein
MTVGGLELVIDPIMWSLSPLNPVGVLGRVSSMAMSMESGSEVTGVIVGIGVMVGMGV